MKKAINRRQFAKSAALAGVVTIGLPFKYHNENSEPANSNSSNPENLKISLNAFSFDVPLKSGKMTIDNLLDFCAKTGFDGVDLTGYYFPGYPVVPSDEYIYHVKRKAFRLGLGISGTGIRNDFTWSDPAKRAEEKKLVKEWIIVSEKLGSPLLRIFAGTLSKESFSWDERAKWISDDIRECAEFGKNHGVMMGLQNHYDFIKTSSDIEKILGLVNSDWTGLLLDIGSFHSSDPYKDIALTVKYAISWQLKEKLFVIDTQIETDYTKVIQIIKQSGYAGYLPLETLGQGDPYQKVEALFNKVRKVLM